MRFLITVWVLMLGLAAGAQAQTVYEFPEDEATAAFVANEVIATFYHELGHALIDVLQLPVLGKEEDAADHLSVILMNDIWEEDAAAEILASDATAYALMAAQREAGGEEPAYSDEHSLDLQRYYTVVCLFYGANPDARADLAQDLELPPERAERCPDEWESAAVSWDAVLAEEVIAINDRFGMPDLVTVQVADCGVVNAFYNPEDRMITLCTEYAQNLQDMWEAE